LALQKRLGDRRRVTTRIADTHSFIQNQRPPMKRSLDIYDYIGLALLAFVIALWITHFIMPDTLPPEP
jgi:hypothetical protein